MNTNKLLNSLIDEIGEIEMSAYSMGSFQNNLKEKNRCDKRLARHKTKAFAIINKLMKHETYQFK